MLLKLLICDDEESIRAGLKCIVDWEELGFTVSAECSNGSEALAAVKDYRPDLVLLDIKMPGLTGIEVLEKAGEHCKSQGIPFPAFLILSGFSDFEYAQKALNFGAKGYLLKPVDEDILCEKVRAIASEIKKSKSFEEDSKTAKKFEAQEFYRTLLTKGVGAVFGAEGGSLVKSDFNFGNVFNGAFHGGGDGGGNVSKGASQGKIGSGGALFGEALDGEAASNDFYTVLFFAPEFFPNEDKSLILKCIENYFSFFSKVVLNIDGNTVLLLKNANDDTVKNCIERFTKRYSGKTFITKGKRLSGLQGAVESYNEARKYAGYLFYISDKSAVTEAEVKQASGVDYGENQANQNCSGENQTDCGADGIDNGKGGMEIGGKIRTIDDAINKLIFCIETYDKSNLEAVLETVKTKLFKIEKKPSEVKKNMISLLVELRNRLSAKYPEREILDAKSFDVISHILAKDTFSEAFDYFKGVLYDLIENFNTNTADSVIVKVISYIKSNFASDLKLESLGEMFNCNSAYLGKKFKKHTGVQFNTFLDNLRIEEAKEKIMHSDLKIYQISKLVGYANTDYFFMKFKKATGLTPKEFKMQFGKE